MEPPLSQTTACRDLFTKVEPSPGETPPLELIEAARSRANIEVVSTVPLAPPTSPLEQP